MQHKHKKGKTISTINDRNQNQSQTNFSSTLHGSISRYLNKKGDNGMFRDNGFLDPHAERYVKPDSSPIIQI